jgi:cell division protein ZapA
MKQIEVTILGQSYLLGCPEGGDTALLEAVATVDSEMSAIRDGGKVKARERIAVLAALNLAYALAGRPPAKAIEKASDTGNATAAHGAPAAPGAVDIEGLIRRVDQALGAHGQLL